MLYTNELTRPIRLCPKLTNNHYELPFGYTMKVWLAAELLSHSVDAALKTLVNEGILTDEEVDGTVEFVFKKPFTIHITTTGRI